MNKQTIQDGQPADIALCASVAFKDKWLIIKDRLQAACLTVHAPLSTESWGWDTMSETEMIDRKKHLIDRHISNIRASRAVLVCNYDKNEETGYVGPNTLIEMTAAYLLEKPIYVLNEIPIEGKGLEIRAFGGIVLDGSIDALIKIFSENGNE